MKYYIIDGFTDELFKGNPAGVCVLDFQLPDPIMQRIAFENNLAETAFVIKKEPSVYSLRWFTPEIEMDLCGHATLATAFVIMNYYASLDEIQFETKSGRLSVRKNGDYYTMNFPSRPPVPIPMLPFLEQGLGCKILETYQSRDLLAVVENERVVRELDVDLSILRKINKDVSFTIIVSAKGSSCDFVSRFFIPNGGITEDPVTGSAHSTLIPFWADRLNKTKMVAKQLSLR